MLFLEQEYQHLAITGAVKLCERVEPGPQRELAVALGLAAALRRLHAGEFPEILHAFMDPRVTGKEIGRLGDMAGQQLPLELCKGLGAGARIIAGLYQPVVAAAIGLALVLARKPHHARDTDQLDQLRWNPGAGSGHTREA